MHRDADSDANPHPIFTGEAHELHSAAVRRTAGSRWDCFHGVSSYLELDFRRSIWLRWPVRRIAEKRSSNFEPTLSHWQRSNRLGIRIAA